MELILRIFFSGMIAFVPSSDGKDVTVLLLNTHGYELSDGSTLVHHQPLLLARAQSCSGNCDHSDLAIAKFLYSDKSDAQAVDSLAGALAGGGAWQLANTELTVRKNSTTEGCLHPPLLLQSNVRTVDANGSSPIPQTPAELPDFSWVTDLTQVVPQIGAINPAVLAVRPPASLVTARLKLHNGKITTYSLSKISGKIKPIHFRASGQSTDSPYSQAVANWVVVEIRVPGDSVDLVTKDFDDDTTRTMRLTPENGRVDVAVMNIPSPEVPAIGQIEPMPQPGTHFEEYFELAQTPPVTRPIPYASTSTNEPATDWHTLDPDGTLYSELLDRLRMNPGRGIYDRVLCPMVQYP